MGSIKLKQLSRIHVIFLTQSAMIGTGILSLPQKMSGMGYSQWFMPIVFGFSATLTLLPMIWLCSKFPKNNIFQMNEIILGKMIGKFISLLIIIQFIISSTGIISDYMHLIQSTALPEQTITLPVICFLLLVIYIVNSGILSISKFCIMTFFVTVWLFPFLVWAFEKGEISHLLPLNNFTSKEFYEAFKGGFFSILGYELILIYFPYIIDQKKAFFHSLIGIWISILLCLVTTFICSIYYSEWQLKNIEYSVLNLFKAGEISFIERLDIFGITLWVFHILTTVIVYIWSAQQGIVTLKKYKKKYLLYVIVIIVFCLIIIPSRDLQEKLFLVSNYTGYLVIIWPVSLSLIYLLRKE